MMNIHVSVTRGSLLRVLENGYLQNLIMFWYANIIKLKNFDRFFRCKFDKNLPV